MGLARQDAALVGPQLGDASQLLVPDKLVHVGGLGLGGQTIGDLDGREVNYNGANFSKDLIAINPFALKNFCLRPMAGKEILMMP